MLKKSKLEKTLEKMMSPKGKSEFEEQVAVMDWANKLSKRYPFLSYLFHIPNGGYRDPITASRLKRAGVKPNIPDLFLPFPRVVAKTIQPILYYGLFIEMKKVGKKCGDGQLKAHEFLRGQGYRVDACEGASSAKIAICNYLNLNYYDLK